MCDACYSHNIPAQEAPKTAPKNSIDTGANATLRTEVGTPLPTPVIFPSEVASTARLKVAYLELVKALNEVSAPRTVHDLVQQLGPWLGIPRYR